MRRFLVVLPLLAASVVAAQPGQPTVTNIAALLAYPEFYANKPIIVRGEVTPEGDRLVIRGAEGPRALPIIVNGTPPGGLIDVRAEMIDVGHLRPDEMSVPTAIARLVGEGREWPKPGELLVLSVSAFTEAVRPNDPTIRSVVLEPQRFEGRTVTVRGQYRARNLFGDVPRAPGISRFDFLIRYAGAAIWVTGTRPRGKGFDFELDSKVDTDHWLEVTGTVHRGRGLEWLEATSVKLSEPIKDVAAPAVEPVAPVPPPVLPPPEIVFSIPTQDETQVAITTTVRIQASTDLDPASLADHIRIGYVDPPRPGAPPPAPMEFTVNYDRGNRSFEIRFARPLERFRTVKVELLEGIVGTDKQPLKPWTLTFSLGG